MMGLNMGSVKPSVYVFVIKSLFWGVKIVCMLVFVKI